MGIACNIEHPAADRRQDDISSLVEGLMSDVVKDAKGIDLRETYPGGQFPRMPF